MIPSSTEERAKQVVQVPVPDEQEQAHVAEGVGSSLSTPTVHSTDTIDHSNAREKTDPDDLSTGDLILGGGLLVLEYTVAKPLYYLLCWPCIKIHNLCGSPVTKLYNWYNSEPKQDETKPSNTESNTDVSSNNVANSDQPDVAPEAQRAEHETPNDEDLSKLREELTESLEEFNKAVQQELQTKDSSTDGAARQIAEAQLVVNAMAGMFMNALEEGVPAANKADREDPTPNTQQLLPSAVQDTNQTQDLSEEEDSESESVAVSRQESHADLQPKDSKSSTTMSGDTESMSDSSVDSSDDSSDDEDSDTESLTNMSHLANLTGSDLNASINDSQKQGSAFSDKQNAMGNLFDEIEEVVGNMQHKPSKLKRFEDQIEKSTLSDEKKDFVLLLLNDLLRRECSDEQEEDREMEALINFNKMVGVKIFLNLEKSMLRPKIEKAWQSYEMADTITREDLDEYVESCFG